MKSWVNFGVWLCECCCIVRYSVCLIYSAFCVILFFFHRASKINLFTFLAVKVVFLVRGGNSMTVVSMKSVKRLAVILWWIPVEKLPIGSWETWQCFIFILRGCNYYLSSAHFVLLWWLLIFYFYFLHKCTSKLDTLTAFWFHQIKISISTCVSVTLSVFMCAF